VTAAAPGPSPADALRLRIDLSYDGTGFAGWARQPGLPTLQQDLEDALAAACGASVAVVCAGRTDAGVHARGQVVHVDVPGHWWRSRTPFGVLAQLNRATDDRLWIRRVATAPAGFDARFSALSRHYVYRLSDDPVARDPLTRGWVVAHRRRLDVPAMSSAAVALVGEHDFAAFCRPRPGATTVRRILGLAVHRDSQARVAVEIGADAFCHSMVRAIVGALVAVGEGRREPDWVGRVLASRARDSAATVMAAGGLVLERVEYPADELLADRARQTRRLRGPSGAAGCGW
jgi:tRNA pseudouridine38-40 synthase